MVLLIKCDPWSLIRVIGHPNLVMIFSYINLAAISLEHVSTSCASAHLVTYSTAVIMYLTPVLFTGMGNGPTKSMAQISNVKLGFTDIKGIYVLGRGQPSHWHWSHWLTNFLQSLYNAGHHSLECWIFLVVVSA